MVGLQKLRIVAVVAALGLLASGCAWLERASTPNQPGQADADSFGGVLTPDGKTVVFASSAGDLVPGKSDDLTTQIYARSRSANFLQLVSVATNGGFGDNASSTASITPDGRYAVFNSSSSNLVANDTNGSQDVFRRDLVNNVTVRVSVGAGGAQASGNSSTGNAGSRAISDDGRFVVFAGPPSLVAGGAGTANVYVRDVQSGTTTRVSVSTAGVVGNGGSTEPSISADGRSVAFTSDSSNLVASDTNTESDVFVRDRQTNTTTRVSVASAGTQANSFSNTPAISGDGRYVVFTSFASNLVTGDSNSAPDLFVRDRTANTTTRVSISDGEAQGNGQSLAAVISANGRYILFTSSATNLVTGDTNGMDDIFLRDVTGGTTKRVSVSTAGTQGVGDSTGPTSISDDGRLATFDSFATNLASGDTNAARDVFVRDLQTNTTTRESVSSEANSDSFGRPALSRTGRYVAFESSATNLVAGDTNMASDVFVRDLLNGTTQRVSVSTAGVQGNGGSTEASISDDGRYVAFTSTATNLVGSDTNNAADVFVRDRTNNTTTRVSVDFGGAQANGPSSQPSIGGDGTWLAFTSSATNLSAIGDTNNATDVFLTSAHPTGNPGTILVSFALTPAQVNANGASAKPSLTTVGTGGNMFVAYQSSASNIDPTDANGVNDIFRFDFAGFASSRVTAGNGGSTNPSITEDGAIVAYQSTATNLINNPPGETDTNGVSDVFVTTVASHTTTRASDLSGFPGAQANGASVDPSISDNGRYVSYTSNATNLVSGDTNAASDIFVRDRTRNLTSRVSTQEFLAQNPSLSLESRITGDGRYVAFRTDGAIAQDGHDFNRRLDVYVRATVVPTLTSINAASGARGTTANYTFTGTYFFGNTVAKMPNDIVVNSTTVVDENHLTVNLTIPANAPTGQITAYVQVPGTGAGTSTGSAGQCACFTVT